MDINTTGIQIKCFGLIINPFIEIAFVLQYQETLLL